MGGLFGKKRDPLTARQALERGRAGLEGWAGAASAAPCCLYTAVDDSEQGIGRDGRCTAWHCDFFSPETGECRLIRVESTGVRARTLKEGPVEYVRAVYSLPPPTLPEGWPDSPAWVKAALAAVGDGLPRGEEDRYSPLALLWPSTALRYAREGRLLTREPPGEAAFLCLLAHEDPEDQPTFAVWIDAGGQVVHRDSFTFPALFDHGFSRHW